MCLRHASIPMHSFFQTFGITTLAAVAIVLRSGSRFEFSKLKTVWPFFALGSCAALGAIGFQLYVVRLAPVGMVEGAKRALTLVFTLVFAKLFFSEAINSKKLFAVMIMTMGLLLLLV
ncbi:hypothetical protein GW915_06725, partial [bacterium]|nr:hypothetical protein [bacterium]